MILFGASVVTTRFDVLARGKVVGAATASREIAADRSGKRTTRMRFVAGGTSIELDSQSFFAAGGRLRREVREVVTLREGSRSRVQTISDFDPSGVTAVVTRGGERKVQRLAAPPGLPVGNPWRYGVPKTLPPVGTTFRFAEFDATAVRWREITGRFLGRGAGGFDLEFLEGARRDRERVDEFGETITLQTANGFALRRRR